MESGDHIVVTNKRHYGVCLPVYSMGSILSFNIQPLDFSRYYVDIIPKPTFAFNKEIARPQVVKSVSKLDQREA